MKRLTKFSDDTTVEGCIEKADETACRDEVQRMVSWSADNNLELNVSKTKEMIVDFRRKKTPIRPLSLNGVEVEEVESFRFLGTIISSDLSWGKNTLCITKQAKQRMYFRSSGDSALRIQNHWERVAIHRVYLPCSLHA